MSRQTLHVFSALLIVSCSDTPSGLKRPSIPVEGDDSPGVFGDTRAVKAFDVDVQVTGSLIPGEPARVTMTARSNVTAPHAEVFITTPELQLIPQLSNGKGRVDLQTVIAAAERFSGPVTPGMVITLRIDVAPRDAGYYSTQVVARAGPEASHPFGSRPLADVVRAERWLLFDEPGGRVTDRFDPSVFRHDYVPTIGPLRARAHSPSRGSDLAFRDPGDCDTWQFVYYDQEGQLRPISVYADVELREDQSGNVVWNGTTSGSEAATCAHPGTGAYGTATLGNSYAYVANWVGGFGGGPSTGAVYQYVVWAPAAQLHTNFSDFVPRTHAFFGFSRSSIAVYIGDCPDKPDTPCYQSGPDRIWMPEYASTLNDYSLFAQPHEYGHAFHERALGGITTECEGEDPFHQPLSMGCAYKEGIADLVAAVMTVNAPYQYHPFDRRVETDSAFLFNYAAFGAPDGSRWRGAISAFLYDLIDSPSDPDGVAVEDDSVTYTGVYLGQAIKTCHASTFGVGQTRPWGIDHLIYCLERTIDPAVTGNAVYFPQRNPDPYNFWEAANEPPTWSQSAIRGQWLRNLYPETAPPSPPPPPPPDDPPPPPPPPPPCDPPPPGGCMDQLRTAPQTVPARSLPRGVKR